jgi:hypothetical protein
MIATRRYNPEDSHLRFKVRSIQELPQYNPQAPSWDTFLKNATFETSNISFNCNIKVLKDIFPNSTGTLQCIDIKVFIHWTCQEFSLCLMTSSIKFPFNSDNTDVYSDQKQEQGTSDLLAGLNPSHILLPEFWYVWGSCKFADSEDDCLLQQNNRHRTRGRCVSATLVQTMKMLTRLTRKSILPTGLFNYSYSSEQVNIIA